MTQINSLGYFSSDRRKLSNQQQIYFFFLFFFLSSKLSILGLQTLGQTHLMENMFFVVVYFFLARCRLDFIFWVNRAQE